jgi:hypothetical protein
MRSSHTLEKPDMPCPAVIDELDAMMRVLTPGFTNMIPETRGWFTTIYDAKRAILSKYYIQLDTYNRKEKLKQEKLASKKAARVGEKI